MLKQPITVYSNWMSCGPGSDFSELTEEVALMQLDHFLHIRHLGLKMDYCLMERDWFDRKGGYRAWKKPGWAAGPQRWLQRCIGNNVKPGLWIRGNMLDDMQPESEWRTSLNWSLTAMCLFDGGYLNHFLDTLEFWYGKGIRLFKIDEMDFTAATPEMEADLTPSEIWTANCSAFREGLKDLRTRCPSMVLLAGEGFLQKPPGEYRVSPGELPPFRKCGDARWQEVFDAQCACEQLPSTLPMSQFWRALETHTDQKINEWKANGFALAQIANSGFSVGNSNAIFNRGMRAWKSAALLALARGGWALFIQGDLREMDDEKVQWLIAVQLVYTNLLKTGETLAFGGTPGRGEPYGYASMTDYGAWITVVNPSQSVAKLALPIDDLPPGVAEQVRVHFCDLGFLPTMKDEEIILAPEQMALVGAGKLAGEEYELGYEEDVKVPTSIAPIHAESTPIEGGVRLVVQYLPRSGSLRFVLRQFDAANGHLRPSAPGAKSPLLRISATIGDKGIALTRSPASDPWCGCGWLVAECKLPKSRDKGPLVVDFTSHEPGVILKANIYSAQYQSGEMPEKPRVTIA